MTSKIQWSDVVIEFRRLLPAYHKATKYHYDSTSADDGATTDGKVMIEGPQPDSVWGELLLLDAVVCFHLSRPQTSSLRTVNHHEMLQTAIKTVIRRGYPAGATIRFPSGEVCVDLSTLPAQWSTFENWSLDSPDSGYRRPHKAVSLEKMNKVLRACDLSNHISLSDLLNRTIRRIWYSESTLPSAAAPASSLDQPIPSLAVAAVGLTSYSDWHDNFPNDDFRDLEDADFDVMSPLDDRIEPTARGVLGSDKLAAGWDSLSLRGVASVSGEQRGGHSDSAVHTASHQGTGLAGISEDHESRFDKAMQSISSWYPDVDSSLSHNSSCKTYPSSSVHQTAANMCSNCGNINSGTSDGINRQVAAMVAPSSDNQANVAPPDMHQMQAQIAQMAQQLHRLENTITLLVSTLIRSGVLGGTGDGLVGNNDDGNDVGVSTDVDARVDFIHHTGRGSMVLREGSSGFGNAVSAARSIEGNTSTARCTDHGSESATAMVRMSTSHSVLPIAATTVLNPHDNDVGASQLAAGSTVLSEEEGINYGTDSTEM